MFCNSKRYCENPDISVRVIRIIVHTDEQKCRFCSFCAFFSALRERKSLFFFTPEKYQWVLSRVEELLPLVGEDTPKDDPNSIELEILSNLVADYSDENFSIGEPSLCDILKLRMYEMGLTQKGLAEVIGVSPSRVSDFFSGRAEPTLSVARRICKNLNIDASVVLGL